MSTPQRSQPYFFSFDTKSRPGRILAHCVRFETLDIQASGFNQTEFTLFGADYDKDERVRVAFDLAMNFVMANETTPLVTRLKELLHQVKDCCITEAWDEIDSDELCKLIEELKLIRK